MTRHVSGVRLRWSDADELGHVNNVVFLRYLQEARVSMLFVDASAHGAPELARGVVVHRHEIAYLRPLPRRPEPVRVETWVREVRAASFELGYEVVDETGDGRTVHAVASSVLVPYDLAGERPRRVSAAERAVLEGFRDAGPAPERIPAWVAAGGRSHRSELAVRFDDLDSFGHVNNAMIAEYLQQARLELVQHHLADSQAAHEAAVVAGLSVDYLRPVPATYEPLVVDVWVTRVGTSSFDLAYEVRDEATVFARATTAMVGYDSAAGRSRPLGEGERLALKELCDQ